MPALPADHEEDGAGQWRRALRWRSALTLTSLVAAILAGCVGPNFAPPVAATAASRTCLGTGKPVASPVNVLAGTDSAPTEVEWWHVFHDPELSKLEGRVALANLDVRTATLRIAQSRSQVTASIAAMT